MLKEAKVLGVRLDKSWSYQGRSGVHHVVYVVWCDPLPQSDTVNGYACESLKFPATPSETDLQIRTILPGDIVDIDFNRYGKPEYLKAKGHHEHVL